MQIRRIHHFATRTLKAMLFAAGMYLLAACNVVGTYNVNTTDDTVDIDPGDGQCADANGMCSLRAATQEANATAEPSTIILEGGETYTLTIPQPVGGSFLLAEHGGLHLTAPTTIHTNETGQATIDVDHLLDLTTNKGVTAIMVTHGIGTTSLNNIEITNTGANGSGIAIVVNSGTEAVHINNSRIHHNTGPYSIFHRGLTLEVNNSSIDNNSSTGSTSVLANFGNETLRLFQTTIADNTSQAAASAIWIRDGALEVESSTITNTSNKPAFDLNEGSVHIITSSVIETTVASCSAALPTSGGNNISSDDSCGLTSAGDVQNQGDNVKPLADNGGPTLTRMPNLLGGAHDGYACPAGVGPDARGLPRPEGGLCDKGAVEAQPGEATVAD